MMMYNGIITIWGLTMQEMTIVEIAKRLRIPESTLRLWRDKYGEFIPTMGTGRGRRYDVDALPVFRTIAELSAKGLSTADVANDLEARYKRFIDDNSSGHNNTAAMVARDSASSLELIAGTLDALIKRQDNADQLREENARLRADLDDVKNRLAALEQIRLPWWKRRKT